MINAPYKITHWDTTENLNGYQCEDKEENIALKVYDVEEGIAAKRKNADFIVKALNMHSGLVYALKRLVKLCEKQEETYDGTFGQCRSIEELRCDMKDLPDELILAYYVLKELEEDNGKS